MIIGCIKATTHEFVLLCPQSHAIGEEEESKKSGKGSVKKESTDMTK